MGHFNIQQEIVQHYLSSLIASEYPGGSSGDCCSISRSSRRSCCGPHSCACFLSQLAWSSAPLLFSGYQSEKLFLFTSTGFPVETNVDNFKAIRQLLKSVWKMPCQLQYSVVTDVELKIPVWQYFEKLGPTERCIAGSVPRGLSTDVD